MLIGKSSPTDLAPPSDGVFYGWRIVSASFFVQFVTSGTTFYPYGVLLKPISEDLGISRFAVGTALSIFMLVGALTGPLIGREVDRRGARGLMLLGTGLMSAGFLAFAHIESVVGLYLAFGGIVALGAALLGPITNTALVASWFHQARGTALGISQIGISISGMVMAYVTTWLVAAYGWRGAILSFTAVPLLLVAPVVAAVVVNRPQDRGLQPDGLVLEPGAAPPAPPLPEPGSLREALRERDLWLIALAVGLNFTVSGSVLQVIHSHVSDLGYTAARAAGVLSLMAGTAALGKPLFGTLADRTSVRSAVAASIGCQVVGLVAILLAPDYAALLGASVIFGLGCGGQIPLFGLLAVARFGAARLGRMMGAAMLLMLPLQLAGLPFATAMFDRNGSYAPAFVSFLGFYAVATVALFRLPSGSIEE
jgi:predicted MFS family arabinose efflux permease